MSKWERIVKERLEGYYHPDPLANQSILFSFTNQNQIFRDEHDFEDWRRRSERTLLF